MYHDETSLREMLGRRSPADAPFIVTRLSGGVSSLVFMVRDANGRRFVVKQTLAELAVNEHWPAPRERVFNEIEGMRATREILGAEQVPEILFVDEPAFLYGMEAVPENAILFKSALLSGAWKPEWFQSAGEMLGKLHNSKNVPGSIKVHFESQNDKSRHNPIQLFHDLRLDPYFKHTARMKPEFNELMAKAVEIAGSEGRALVHGDFSPKNIFVAPQTGRMILLDFEVMHWGNPAFDVAFFLTHPLAKAIHLPQQAARLAEGINAFWKSYQQCCGSSGAREADVLILWAAIAAARIAGKSPLEYMRAEQEKSALLNWGATLQRRGISTIADAAACLARGGNA